MPLPVGTQIYLRMDDGAGATSTVDYKDNTRIFSRMGACIGVNGGKFKNSFDINGITVGQDGLTTLINTSVMDIPLGGQFYFGGWVNLDAALTTTQYIYNGITDGSNFHSLKIGFTAGQTFITMDAFDGGVLDRVLIQPAPFIPSVWDFVEGERGIDGQFRFWLRGLFLGKGAHSSPLHAATRINIGQLNRFIGDTAIHDLMGGVDDFLLSDTAIYNSDDNHAVPTAPRLPTSAAFYQRKIRAAANGGY